MRLQNILCGPHDAGTATSHVPKNVPPSSVETPAWQAGWRGHQWHSWTHDAWPVSVSSGPPPRLQRRGGNFPERLSLQGLVRRPQGPASPRGSRQRSSHTGPLGGSLMPSIPGVTEPRPLSQWPVPLCPLCWGAHPFEAASPRTFRGSFPSARLSSSLPQPQECIPNLSSGP